jgi:DNA mismatch endonuclease, patch repair protein
MRPEDPTYPKPSSAQASAAMRGNRKRDTRPEVALRSGLHRLGHRYRKNLRIRLPTLSVTPDIVFPAARVAVFVDGCYWHSCPLHGTQPQENSAYWEAKLSGNLARDRRVDRALAEAGWTVVRIWEHVEPAAAVAEVAAAVARGRLGTCTDAQQPSSRQTWPGGTSYRGKIRR